MCRAWGQEDEEEEEEGRLREVRKLITEVQARKRVRLAELVVLMRKVITDDDELAALCQEEQDLVAANATRDLSLHDRSGRQPCIGPICFWTRCARARGGECWIHDEKWKHAVKAEPADDA